MISAQKIVELHAQRRLNAGAHLARMAEVQQLYNGDIVVPLPELNSGERSSVPNRVKQGLTQFAERIASSVPELTCPALRPGIQLSVDRAYDRRRAILGWWENCRLPIRMRQRARYLQGYASAPVEIRWDPTLGVPVYEERNPLTTFPSFMRSPADMCPNDCIFEVPQDLGWLHDNYPNQTALLHKGQSQDGRYKRDLMFTTLRYVDREECVVVVMGANTTNGDTPPPGSMAVELERYPNRSERCPVVIPRMISLDKLHGQFDDVYGMHQTEAKLTALSIIATQKGVFADEWLVAHPNEEPIIVQVPDNAAGVPGIVKGGQLVPRRVDPQFQTNLTIDRLAAAQNQSAGLTSELQGVAGSNIRTGARASTLLSNVIDFPIQEGQELLAHSVQEENKVAVAFAKAYGDGPKSFYISWPGAAGQVTYDPKDTFETDMNVVRYPLGGADQAGLVISSGQRVQMGTMSHRKFMEIDPLIEDAELEHDRIVSERFEEALISGIQQKVASGEMDPMYVAEMMEIIESNRMSTAKAYKQVQKEAQERQAQVAPSPGAPETQPGLAGPPQQQDPGAAQGPSMEHLSSILASLRAPQQQITPQEVGAA